MTENKTDNQLEAEKKPGNVLSKLIKGQFGLAVTFWIAGIAVGIISMWLLIGIIAITEDEHLFMFLFSIWVMYEIAVAIGVWKAASRHMGSRGWAALAQVVTLLSTSLMLIIWCYLLMIFTGDYPNH